MMIRLTGDPLDIAPDAPKYSRAAWILGALAIVSACVVIAILALRWTTHREQERSDAEHRIAQEKARPPVVSAADMRLLSQFAAPWPELLGILEESSAMVRGTVSLISVSPMEADPMRIAVRLSGTAATLNTLPKYMDALAKHAKVADVELLSHEKTGDNGDPVVHFELKLQLSQEQREAISKRPELPPTTRYDKDLAALFALSRDRQVRFESVQYRRETQADAGVQVRRMDIQMSKDYAKFKAFLSAVLDSYPHGAVKEISFERNDPKGAQLSVNMTFLLFYRMDGGP